MKKLKKYIIENVNVFYKQDIIDFLISNKIDNYNSFEEFYDNININDNDIYIIEKNFYEYKHSVNIPFDNYISYQNIVNENLSDSIKLNTKTICKLIKQVNNITNIEVLNDFKLILYVNDKFNMHDTQFESILNFYNYFIQSYNDNEIYIEGRKPEKINYDYTYVYHITDEKYWNKIQKVGLCPKKTFELSPYRIYVFAPSKNVFTYIKSFINVNNKINKPILLKINLDKLNEHKPSKLILYGDPSYNIKSALFTLEKIPTKYIEKVENF